jgi:hydroxyacylglutathione hydrolase
MDVPLAWLAAAAALGLAGGVLNPLVVVLIDRPSFLCTVRLAVSHPKISTFVLGDYQTNCYVVSPTLGPAGNGLQPCWIVDCGLEPDEMLDWIADNRLQPRGLVLTHSHLDHIAGVDRALSRFGAMPLYIHRAEAGFCSDPMLNLSALIGLDISCTEPDHILNDGDQIDMVGTTWRVMHTPGHSPGGICLIHDESRQALVGDTLFAGSIGRFDFPTSSADDLRRSIARIMELSDDFTVHPGHGPSTTIGGERRTNPYVIGGF